MSKQSLVWDSCVAVATVLIALLLMMGLNPWLEMTETPFLIFFGAVPLAALSRGDRAGILATVLSASLANFFFIPPVHSFSLNLVGVGRTLIFVLEGILISSMAGSLRRTQQRARESILRDLARLKQAEAEIAALNNDLQNRLNELETLFEVIPIGILISDDLEFKQVRANPAFAQVLGIPTDGNASWTPPDSPPPAYKVLRNGRELTPEETPLRYAAIHGVNLERVEVDILRSDGVLFNLYGYASPLLDEQKRPRGSVGAFLDITERKKIEAEREQLFEREKAAREKAEAVERQSRFLAEASVLLSSSLDYEHTLKSMAQLAVPTLADWCVVDMVAADGTTGDRTLKRLATAHVNPAKVEWAAELYRRYPPNLDAAQGIAQVLRTGQSEYYPDISNEQLVASARDKEHLRLLKEAGLKSVMIVPLIARGKTLGTISFVMAESGRSYSLNDLSFAEELARRAAIAFDNARLYQEAQQAKQAAERAADRTARLQAVTAALSESLTPLQVADVIVEQSMAFLEADSALVSLLTADRQFLEIVQAVGYAPDLVEAWSTFSINAPVPLAETVRTGQPVWAELQADRIARYPHLVEIYQRYDYEGWMSLPLIVEGKPLGGLLLSFKAFKDLTPDDRRFVQALTQQCAQAIARAQLYEAERQARSASEAARQAAEQASRVKDEFLAVLSHELRTPLNPILGWTKLLRAGSLDPQRTALAIETIERNAKLQTQLIEDLLDISRILQGKLVLNIAPVDLAMTIEAAKETVRLAAEAKAIQVQTQLDPTVGLIMGDANRLQQVIWNLLSNAVKFTPQGGQITIRLTAVDANAQISVEDTGKGISADFLPYVFEYFRQADSSTTRRFGGLGLGLAIARQIVELHGGSIQATSAGEGQGATFVVKLPLIPEVNRRINPALAAPGVAAADTPSLQGNRILVVDDEPDARELVGFILEQSGAEVTLVGSAAEVLKCLHEGLPDLLISDVAMPEVNGYMLIQQVRALAPEQGGQIPAIALTAHAGEGDRQQALSAGFQQHVSKPIDPEELVQVVAKLVRQPSALPYSVHKI
ncbi:MAG: hypothetical protein Kow00121_40290 [Elainellaceae cyanobacterium]